MVIYQVHLRVSACALCCPRQSWVSWHCKCQCAAHCTAFVTTWLHLMLCYFLFNDAVSIKMPQHAHELQATWQQCGLKS